MRFDDPPRAVTERVDGQGIRMDVDLLNDEERVVADPPEERVVFRQRRQHQGQIRRPGVVLQDGPGEFILEQEIAIHVG